MERTLFKGGGPFVCFCDQSINENRLSHYHVYTTKLCNGKYIFDSRTMCHVKISSRNSSRKKSRSYKTIQGLLESSWCSRLHDDSSQLC